MPLASTGVDVPVVAHHDLMALADMRLAEARALQNGRHYSGAFYLAGYAVELGIKSIIARDKFRGVWPEKDQFRAGYTHNLEDLMQIAGLLVLLAQDSLRDEELDENWRIVRRWRETARYAVYSAQRASAMVLAVRQNRFGVLPWLKRH